jgi:HK97 family phage major capsid protein
MEAMDMPDKPAIEVLKVAPMMRSLSLDTREMKIDEKARTVTFPFSSELPVRRYYGEEILDHSPGAARFERLDSGAAVLVDHHGDQIGVTSDPFMGEDRRAYITIRFSENAYPDEVFKDVVAGIRKNVSFGYRIFKAVEEHDEEKDTINVRVTDWMPFEISIVSVPADHTVGIGRTENIEENDLTLSKLNRRSFEMPTPEICKLEGCGGELRSEDGVCPKCEKRLLSGAPAKVRAAASPEDEVKTVREKEIKRMDEIKALGKTHAEKTGEKSLDSAKKFIAEGKSVEDFKTEIIRLMAEANPVPVAELGLSGKEVKQFKILNLVRRMMQEQGAGTVAGKTLGMEELRICEAAAEKFGQGTDGESRSGVMIPYDILVQERAQDIPLDVRQAFRDMNVGTATAGGNLVGTNLLAASFIDILRNVMQVFAMGAQTIPGLVGNIAIPRQSGAGTVTWIDTEGGAVAETDQTIDQVTMSPKSLGAYTDMTRQLILQSTPAIETLVRNDLARIIAIAIDLAALHGTGADGQPTGLENVTGIGSVVGGPAGADPTWKHMIDLWKEVAVDNAAFGTLGYLTNSATVGKLAATEKFANGSKMVVEDLPDAMGFAAIGGQRCGVSNQVESSNSKGGTDNLSSAFYGNWADLLIGLWGGLDILVNPYTGTGTGTVRIEMYQSVDVAVRHAESFSLMADIITA